MIRTRIEIFKTTELQTNGSRAGLVVNNTSGVVDLYDDIPQSYTYSVADIRNPENRNSSYSKTIKIPGSKNNNRIFEHIFEVETITNSFNPNKKAKVIVYIDDVEIFRGVLRLRNISVLDPQDNTKIEYDCEIFGKLGDIFTTIGDELLEDLDLSSLNHTYNQSSQSTSWSAATGTGYVYPLIDYGWSTNENDYDVNYLYPAIYVKQYIDKIFDAAGWLYTSTFFNTADFKKLIIPFNGDGFKLDDGQINLRKFRASIGDGNDVASDDQTISPPASVTPTWVDVTITNNNDSTGSNFDNNGTFNTGTYKFTAPAPGWYDFYLGVRRAFNVTVAGIISYDLSLEIFKEDATTGAISGLANTGMGNNASTPVSFYASTATTGEQYATNFTTSVSQVFLKAGDKVYGNFKHKLNYGSTATWTTKLKSTNHNFNFFYNAISRTQVADGDQCVLNNCIPKNIKQKDFLKSIIKMFNLYCDTDRANDNKLIIEPRDDFYSSGVTVDWSAKLDKFKDIIIEPMGALEARKYWFKYKEDQDYYNKLYQDTHGRTYGDREVFVDNDFIKNDTTIDAIFSPTPSVGSFANNRIIPKIFTVDANGNKASKTSNPRILYYGGLQSTNVNWNHISTSSGVTTSNSTYPYAGHLILPTSGTYDLSWGKPIEIYWEANSYTDGNLYNVYYKKFIDEITDRDSKIVTAWMYLNPSDLQQLDFRNKFYWDGNYYRLNKIIDYNPLTFESTKCEFLKIKDGLQFTPTVRKVIGGAVGDIGVDSPMTRVGSYQADESSFDVNSGNKVVGIGNRISPGAKRVYVQGNYNVVGKDSEAVSIINSSGCTVNGLNITVINSSGIVATEKNSVYLFGEIVKESAATYSKRILLSPSDITNLGGSAITFIQAKGAGKLIVPISILGVHYYGGTAYSGGQVAFRYNTGVVADDIFTFSSTFTTTTSTRIENVVSVSNNKCLFNKAIEIYATSAISSGTGTMEFDILYRIVSQ